MGVIGSACCSEDKPQREKSAVSPSPRKPVVTERPPIPTASKKFP